MFGAEVPTSSGTEVSGVSGTEVRVFGVTPVSAPLMMFLVVEEAVTVVRPGAFDPSEPTPPYVTSGTEVRVFGVVGVSAPLMMLSAASEAVADVSCGDG